MTERAVGWEGFFNARDLGGLTTLDGGETRRGRVFRSATLAYATSAGWDAALATGVRTVVSLSDDDEVPPGEGVVSGVPASVDHVRVPTDAVDDTELWRRIDAEGLDNTPLYFPLLLGRHPDRLADAVRAVARARPGAVLVHCGAGRDRTGLVTALLLRLAGTTEEAVVADYLESVPALPALAAAMGRASQQHLVDEALRAHGHTARSAIEDVVARLDAPVVLEHGGLDRHDLAAARDRLRT